MSKKDIARLNSAARRNRKGHKYSATAVFNKSQQRRRSLY